MSNKEIKPINPNPDYKDRDILIKPILMFLLGLTVITFVVLVGMRLLFASFERRHAESNATITPMASERLLPSGPRLIPDEPMVLKDYLKEHQTRLTSYEMIDPAGGLVRIPIERAMELVAERGLPRWNEEPAAGTGGAP